MEVKSSNISSQQINLFNKLVDEWWSSDNLLLKMNNTRVPTLLKYLKENGFISLQMAETEKPLTGLNILDIGCGAGIFCEALAMLGANVTGVDAAKDLIECAKLHAKNNKIIHNLTYFHDEIENFAKDNLEKYDVIIASESVEHVNSAELFIESCLKTLKPNGAFFITTINRTIRAWLVMIILYENILNILPKGLHEYNKFITPVELQQLLEKYNCEIIDTIGQQYNYLADVYSLCDHISVLYFLFAIKQ